MSGLKTSGGVQRRVTGFAGADAGTGRRALPGFGGALTAFFGGGGGGWPWMHWDLGRSHSSQ